MNCTKMVELIKFYQQISEKNQLKLISLNIHIEKMIFIMKNIHIISIKFLLTSDKIVTT